MMENKQIEEKFKEAEECLGRARGLIYDILKELEKLKKKKWRKAERF